MFRFENEHVIYFCNVALLLVKLNLRLIWVGLLEPPPNIQLAYAKELFFAKASDKVSLD